MLYLVPQRLLCVYKSINTQPYSLSTTAFTPSSGLASSEDRFLPLTIFLSTTSFPLHRLVLRALIPFPTVRRDVLQVIYCSPIPPCLVVLRQCPCCHCPCSRRQRKPRTRRCSTPFCHSTLWHYKHCPKYRYFHRCPGKCEWIFFAFHHQLQSVSKVHARLLPINGLADFGAPSAVLMVHDPSRRCRWMPPELERALSQPRWSSTAIPYVLSIVLVTLVLTHVSESHERYHGTAHSPASCWHQVFWWC